jgi:hypothetical protein
MRPKRFLRRDHVHRPPHDPHRLKEKGEEAAEIGEEIFARPQLDIFPPNLGHGKQACDRKAVANPRRLSNSSAPRVARELSAVIFHFFDVLVEGRL